MEQITDAIGDMNAAERLNEALPSQSPPAFRRLRGYPSGLTSTLRRHPQQHSQQRQQQQLEQRPSEQQASSERLHQQTSPLHRLPLTSRLAPAVCRRQ